MAGTLYDILRIRTDATQEEVANAFQKALQRFKSMPAEVSANEVKFARMAFDILSVPDKRRDYDEKQKLEDALITASKLDTSPKPRDVKGGSRSEGAMGNSERVRAVRTAMPSSRNAASYLEFLRDNTNYPYLRKWNKISSVVEALALGIAGIYALALIINPKDYSPERLMGVGILLVSVLAYFALRGAHEIVNAIVDVADSTVSNNAANSKD